MEILRFLTRLEGVQRCRNNAAGDPQWQACCPAHNDRKASLSISTGKDGRILLDCKAGCQAEDIVKSMGLDMRDLMPEPVMQPKDYGKIEAEYIYQRNECGDPVLVKVKKRKADGSKVFTWKQRKGDDWIYNANGFDYIPLYGHESIEGQDQLFIVEGEKDVDTMLRFGFPCVTLPNGASQRKLDPRWLDYFKGKDIYMIPDNDEAGQKYINTLLSNIKPVAASVRVLDLRKVWPQLPEKGDITDMAEAVGDVAACNMIAQLCNETEPTGAGAQDPEPWTYSNEIKSGFLSCFQTLDGITEEEPRWFVNLFIPEGQITTFASDGGVGKTSVAINIAASRSAGRPCLLDDPEFTCEPQLVAFLSTEDSVKKKLRKKLREAGADLKNIIVPDFSLDKNGLLRDFKFGFDKMAQFIQYYKPDLCIFDPLQGFIPPAVNMGSRNQMRDCMAPLVSLGEEIGTTFLIICHTNKRKAAYGRDRIADSADLWDISRSVLMMGYTEDQGVRYLSQEKSNYGPMQETRLFTIDEAGRVKAAGTSWKRDREYQLEAADSISTPKKTDCKGWILQALDDAGGSMPIKDLDSKAKAEGYSYTTIKRSKEDLKRDAEIKYIQTGSSKEKIWHISRIQLPEEWLPSDT